MSPTAAQHGCATAVVAAQVSFVKGNDHDAVAAGLKLGAGKNRGNVRAQPVVRGLHGAVVGVIQQVGRHVVVAGAGVERNVRWIGHRIDGSTCSAAVGEISQRVVPLDVGKGVDAFKAGKGQALLIGPPSESLEHELANNAVNVKEKRGVVVQGNGL